MYLGEGAAIGTSIAIIGCSDPDLGRNGQIDVTVSTKGSDGSNLSGVFLLQNGFIKTGRTLDRETMPSYHLDIHACDRAFDKR